MCSSRVWYIHGVTDLENGGALEMESSREAAVSYPRAESFAVTQELLHIHDKNTAALDLLFLTALVTG